MLVVDWKYFKNGDRNDNEDEDDLQPQAGSLLTHLTKNHNDDNDDDNNDDCAGYDGYDDDYDDDNDLHPQAPLSLIGLSSQAEHSLSVNPFKLAGAPWALSLSIVVIAIRLSLKSSPSGTCVLKLTSAERFSSYW